MTKEESAPNKAELLTELGRITAKRGVPLDVMDAAIRGYSGDEINRLEEISSDLKRLKQLTPA